MSSHAHSIKQQFDQILKDTKILCELEPFVKKWSLEETLSNFIDGDEINLNHEETQYNKISEILQTRQETLSNPSDNSTGEKMLRKIKESLEIITPPKSNNDIHNNPIPFHQSHNSLSSEENMLGVQHDQELEKTFKTLKNIEETNAVTALDIDEYNRGLGGKPDGPDLHKTTILEWKRIFVEHWLCLHQSERNQQRELIKRLLEKDTSDQSKIHSTVYTSKPISLLKRNAELNTYQPSLRTSLDNHFIIKKENKNITTKCSNVPQNPTRKASVCNSQPHSTYLPSLVQPQCKTQGKRNNASTTKMQFLQGIGKEVKTASSANNTVKLMMLPSSSSEREKVLGKGTKQGVTSVKSLRDSRKKESVNKSNNNMSHPLRSSTAVKTNIEIQRLSEKVRPSMRPFTSTLMKSRASTPKRPDEIGKLR